MKYSYKRNNGFTLIELLVVFAVISVLAVGYIQVQRRMVDWKNSIDMSSRAKTLRALFESYYRNQLNDLRNSTAIPSGEVGVVPTCANNFSPSTYTGGNLYICANNFSSGPKNTGIDYASAKTGAEEVLRQLASAGAGTDMLNPYDPWNRPLIFVVYAPTAQGNAYCPTTDHNTAKIVVISMGPDGALNTPTGTTARAHLSGIIDSTTGEFNGAWQAVGDDLVYSISMIEIDIEKKKETQSHLNEAAVLFKNSFFKYFYQVITSQQPTPDPTKVNFFSSLFCSNPGATTGTCSFVSTRSSYDIFTNTYGFTTADARDYFGNYLCFDSDINKSLSVESCTMYSFSGTNVGCFSSELSATGFVARVYSVCALAAADRINCNTDSGDIWSSTTSPTLRDSSYVLSVAGMY